MVFGQAEYFLNCQAASEDLYLKEEKQFGTKTDLILCNEVAFGNISTV